MGVVPHAAPTAVNINGPGEGRAIIAERRDFNNLNYSL